MKYKLIVFMILLSLVHCYAYGSIEEMNQTKERIACDAVEAVGVDDLKKKVNELGYEERLIDIALIMSGSEQGRVEGLSATDIILLKGVFFMSDAYISDLRWEDRVDDPFKCTLMRVFYGMDGARINEVIVVEDTKVFWYRLSLIETYKKHVGVYPTGGINIRIFESLVNKLEKDASGTP